MKKVLFILIDAFSSQVATPLIENGRLPHFKQLVERGHFNPECVSIFPSITHACLSSIITGDYPQTHGVLGSHWYDKDDDEIAYYGVGSNIVLNKGIGAFIKECIYKLNHERLCSDTLFQRVERFGLDSACLNYLIYHGDHKHLFNPPFPMELIPGVPNEIEIMGPKNLWIGSFVQDSHLGLEASYRIPHPGNWYGLKDEGALDLLFQLAQNKRFPELTVAYLAENDFISHSEGPENTVDNLIGIDQAIGKMISLYGGMETFLHDICVIISGDHSQVAIRDEPGLATISLQDLLEDYELSKVGFGWEDNDELMICTNMRAAQIYFHHPTPEKIQEVIDKLIPDDRIDLVLWKGTAINEGEHYFVVSTVGQEPLRFWRGNKEDQTAVDHQGNKWCWEGELAIVDGRVQDGTLSFPNYPNAFERIAGILDSPHSGELWLSAAPGYEFTFTAAATHVGGGSHGSLHRSDSIVPLIIAGAPSTFRMPPYPRIIDITPICLDILGVQQSKSFDE